MVEGGTGASEKNTCGHFTIVFASNPERGGCGTGSKANRVYNHVNPRKGQCSTLEEPWLHLASALLDN